MRGEKGKRGREGNGCDCSCKLHGIQMKTKIMWKKKLSLIVHEVIKKEKKDMKRERTTTRRDSITQNAGGMRGDEWVETRVKEKRKITRVLYQRKRRWRERKKFRNTTYRTFPSLPPLHLYNQREKHQWIHEITTQYIERKSRSLDF